MLDKITLTIIYFIHLFVVAFVVLVPFFGKNILLLIHAITVPFIILHWFVNNDTCSLTIIEKNIRNKIYGYEINDNDCFTYRIISPIYKFKTNNKEFTTYIYTVTILLWIITIIHLTYNYCSLKDKNKFILH